MTRRLLWIAAVAALALGPLVLPEFYLTLLNVIGISALVVLGLVLLTGIAGLTSFGQAAFVGTAAYISAYGTTELGLSPWLTLLVGVSATALLALALGAITLRLSGHYLPISTIAWGAAIFFLFARIPVLGGQTGMTGIPPITIAGYPLVTGRSYYYLIWTFVLIAMLAITSLLRSRTGRAIRALRGGALMAESFGIDVPRTRMAVFVYAAVLAALAGWLYVHFMRFSRRGSSLDPAPQHSAGYASEIAWPIGQFRPYRLRRSDRPAAATDTSRNRGINRREVSGPDAAADCRAGGRNRSAAYPPDAAAWQPLPSGNRRREVVRWPRGRQQSRIRSPGRRDRRPDSA